MDEPRISREQIEQGILSQPRADHAAQPDDEVAGGMVPHQLFRKPFVEAIRAHAGGLERGVFAIVLRLSSRG